MAVPIASAFVIEQMPKKAIADVPFPFQVEGQALPPGTYSVKQMSRFRSIRIQNQAMSGASKQCVPVKRTWGKAKGARLVFEAYGDRYFLSEVWFESDGSGLILRKSPDEVRMASGENYRKEAFIQFQ